MSRRRKAVKREVMPDPKFSDVVVSKFTSCLMYDGKDLQQKRLFMVLSRLLKRNQVQKQSKFFMKLWRMFNLSWK